MSTQNASSLITLQINITDVILEIETYYPELYQHLDELPQKLPKKNGVTLEEYKAYYAFLKTQLAHHKENHQWV